jgi:hypothetical protein
MNCSRAKKIWFGSKLGVIFNSNHRNFIDWLLYCFTTLKDEDLSYMAAITYGIWFARNQQVFENQDIEDITTIDKAYSSIIDFRNATQADSSNNQNSYHYSTIPNHRSQRNRIHQTSHKWKKPKHGEIKGNCDANLSVEGVWGVGAIFRDYEGQILASATWLLPGISDPKTAEACALYLLTNLAADCCFTSVVLESDCINIIKEVNESQSHRRTYANNLLRSVNRLRSRFKSCSFVHTSRRANRVAHSLAGLAHSEPNCIWIEDSHASIVPLVLMDLI